MSWRFNRYKARPAAANRAARVAWDELSQEAGRLQPPRALKMLWYAPEMHAWAAELTPSDDPKAPEFLDIDELEVRDRVNNPHKYTAST